jgi:DNA-binding NtrC family response regulator
MSQEEEGFRLDLYYRLAVVKLEIPSLNQRREDIIPLTKFFLNKFTKKFRKAFTGLTPEAIDALTNYHWTGNVREMRNLIERAVLLGSGTQLSAEQLGIETSQSSTAPTSFSKNQTTLPNLTTEGIDLPAILQSIEKTYFEQALDMASGNATKASKLLKLSRDKFRYRRHKI